MRTASEEEGAEKRILFFFFSFSELDEQKSKGTDRKRMHLPSIHQINIKITTMT
jgi:hypothetical protein